MLFREFIKTRRFSPDGDICGSAMFTYGTDHDLTIRVLNDGTFSLIICGGEITSHHLPELEAELYAWAKQEDCL